MFNEYPKNCIIQNRIIYNTESKSKFKDSFGIKYKEKFWKNLNGERREADGTIVRYVNGYIDGNIYDKQGNIIQSYPAIEFSSNENNGYEYWTRGYPEGVLPFSITKNYIKNTGFVVNLLAFLTIRKTN